MTLARGIAFRARKDDTETMTNVTIISALATRRAHAEPEWGGATFWSGEADVALDTVFRFFNRVDDADCDRLDALGYKLPSLSMDDLVVLDGVTYQVAATGFTPVTPPDPCGWCRRCAIHDDPGGCLEVSTWEREQVGVPNAALDRYWDASISGQLEYKVGA